MKKLLYKISIILTISLILVSCEDKNPEGLDFLFDGEVSNIEVTTGSIVLTSITANSASCTGNYVKSNNVTIKEVGVCWSINSSPNCINDPFNTGYLSNGKFNVSITGLSPNTVYFVLAYAKDTKGNYYYAEAPITFSTAKVEITADFTYTTNDLTVVFTNTSVGATAYTWNFGDGSSLSNETSPSHTYNSTGNYFVTLTASAAGSDNNVKNKDIYVSSGSTGTGTDITFTNNAFTEFSITMNGETKNVASGANVTFYSVPGSSVYYSAYTYEKNDKNVQIGESVSLSNILYISGGTASCNLDIPSDYFYLFFTNSGTLALYDIYVNYGLTSQKYVDAYIAVNNIKYQIGYFKAYTNSNVRLYYGAETWEYYQWEQNINFFLSFETNQKVELVNYSKKSMPVENYSINQHNISIPTAVIPKKK